MTSQVLNTLLMLEVVLLLSSPLAAADEAATYRWTADDLVQQERATGWRLSADGSLAVWIKRVPDKEKDRSVGVLMLTDVAAGTHRRLTVGNDDASSPAFGPDGNSVTFLSRRDPPAGQKALEKKDAGGQLWQLDLRGGEATLLTRIAGGVGGYEWVDDGTIILTARGAADAAGT